MVQFRLQILSSACFALSAVAYVLILGALSWSGIQWFVKTYGLLIIVPAVILGAVWSKNISNSGKPQKALGRGLLVAFFSYFMSIGISFIIYLTLLQSTGIGISDEACLGYLLYLAVPSIIVPLPLALPFGAIAGLVAYLLSGHRLLTKKDMRS